MQCNQPFGNFLFQSIPYNVHYQTIPSFTQVIGEGVVNSVVIPDGSIQAYFIPTLRYDCWPSYHNNPYIDNFNNNKNAEYWFIKDVPLPYSKSFNNRLSTPNGDRLPNHLIGPDYNNNLVCLNYNQKFHNDNTTSTTDILYFYPSLRQDTNSPKSTLAQTNTPAATYNISYRGGNKQPCTCKVSFSLEQPETNGGCICLESASAMSVDSVQDKTSQQNINKKKHKSKVKNPSDEFKHKSHICECNIRVKDTSDKLVTTYTDRACGADVKKGRDTQTHKTKRSDIKTEIWVPVKKKDRKKCRSTINTSDECGSCSNAKHCACASSTDTESQ